MEIELRIGRIMDVSDVEGARGPIYELKVDVGEPETRTLAAGIKEGYSKEELVGREVIVVANLDPKNVAGVESQGMVLAGESDGTLALLMPDKELPPGTRIR